MYKKLKPNQVGPSVCPIKKYCNHHALKQYRVLMLVKDHHNCRLWCWQRSTHL